MQTYLAGIGTSARKLPLGLLAAAGVIALASCAPRQTGPVAPPPPPEKTEEVTPVAKEPHRIAILVPLTGSSAPVGISLANAATLALTDINKQGIRLSSYDTAALGPTAAAQKALNDGAQLILGPLLASDAAAIRAVAEPKGITMLSFSNDSAIAGGNLFVLGFQPQQAVSRVVNYVSSRGVQRFAALVPNGVYGQRTSVAFTSAVSSSGGRVVAMTNFARQPSALPDAARKVTGFDKRSADKDGSKTSRPNFDALLVADSGQIASAFLPQLARFGAPAGSYVLMGTEIWNTEPALSKVNGLHGAFFATVPNSSFQSMSNRYRARFGGSPSRLASLSYDAVLLAASASESAWKGGSAFPKSILADSQGFAGVDGIFRFRNNVAERGLAVQQVTAQGFTTVSPAPRSF